MEKNIKLSPEAARAIDALRHSAGTHNLYRNTITRIFNQILHTAEDLGMDELEAIETLRALDMLRRDITAIATKPKSERFNSSDDDETETAIIDQGMDEPSLMLDAAKRGYSLLNKMAQLLNEAAYHAENAGSKYRHVRDKLNDIFGLLDATATNLEDIMAVNIVDIDQTQETTNILR